MDKISSKFKAFSKSEAWEPLVKYQGILKIRGIWEPLVKIKAFSKPEALRMPRPFASMQYSCAEVATKRPCLKSQPLHSRRFSYTKQQNLYSDKVQTSKRARLLKFGGVFQIIPPRALARLSWSTAHARHSGAGIPRTLWVAVAGPCVRRMAIPSYGDSGYKSPVS